MAHTATKNRGILGQGNPSSDPSSNSHKHPSKNEDALEPIPQPPVHWFTRNLPEIDPAFPSSSNWRLAAIYGDILKLDLGKDQVVIISSYELANEVFDQSRFEKHVAGGLEVLREISVDGLFTAYPGELASSLDKWRMDSVLTHLQNWYKAHRILMPVFGPLAIRKMFPEMQDIISQMVLKWDRLGPDNEIVSADDFTICSQLAFDTIAFCAFSYRFNSFYHDNVPLFAQQMSETLIEAGKIAYKTAIENKLRIFSAKEMKRNIAAMWGLCDDLVAKRKRNPQPDSKDLLNTMLNVADPVTGEKLSDETIRYNMVTFLIAGHETTSSTLSFLFYNLLRNPETYHNAQEEVDRVVGDAVLEAKHLPQLKYLEACIRETLRVLGPINQFAVHPKQDTIIGGKYRVSVNDNIRINIRGLHHDRRVWGPDADDFRPERLLNGGFESLPANAWKPFGNGERACIGRAFAEQEMLMTAAMILQRFQVYMADPSYDLHLKSTLTVKPADFRLKVSRRPGRDMFTGIPGSATAAAPVDAYRKESSERKDLDEGRPLLILYGSNAGTCKYMAEDLQTIAKDRGLNPTVKTMDEATEQLPTDVPIVVITPSYEGKPADNAKKFIAWIESLKPGRLKHVTIAVFGVGNSEWVTTFHKIPKLLDEVLPTLGAEFIQPSAFADVKEDAVGPWEDWRDELLATVSDKSHLVRQSELDIVVERPHAAAKLAGDEISEALVQSNEEISASGPGSAKRHMEVVLPEGVSYEPGDYVVVLPTNPPALVQRVIRRFKLNVDDVVTITGTSKEFLSGSGPITIVDIFVSRVELNTPASKRQLEAIAQTANGQERKQLEILASDKHYNNEVLARRKSVLDILEDFPSATLPLAKYLDMLKPLAPRQYSISSSCLATQLESDDNPNQPAPAMIASITYDVHEAPALSGGDRVFQGIASTYLANHGPGTKIRSFVRRSNTGFHLPSDPATPIIMVAAGTGIAPFRGFIQERAFIAKHGHNQLAPAILYFGCRDFEKDFLYAEELSRWEEEGAVALHPTFSRRGPEEGCHKYVQDRMWEEREELRSLFVAGAKIYVCGSAARLAKSAADVCKRIWLDVHSDSSEEDAQAWLDGIREERYVTDVFD